MLTTPMKPTPARNARVRRAFVRSLLFAAALFVSADLRGDDRATLEEILRIGAENGGVVTIPPGDYYLDGQTPIPLPSNATVSAYGARFRLPERLGDRARATLFAGENAANLRWFGGHFRGQVFDPSRTDNAWEPNANTRGIVITTSVNGTTENLTFRDVTSDGLAGAAITVMGAEKRGDERAIETYARGVTIENCKLLRTGKFMWDYGYLWQITVWPEEHSEAERALAAKYFRHDLVRGPVRMEDGDDRVAFDNANRLPPTPAGERGVHGVCFFGDSLPSNIVRGRQYYVVESEPDFGRISESAGGEPLRFEGSAGPGAKMITELLHAHLALYAPTGSGPGKGAFDLVGCEDVIVRGCRLSALGDTMHIQKSTGVIFSDNHIVGSRMGAFFLAEFCRNATITGNVVDGTNGSRVMSVEKSCENVTIVGNLFKNGGRGSWINQPRNFVLADNVFENNTTKCEPDPARGRKTFLTGDYERYAELYFTTYEPGGTYGDVIVRGNVFTSGEHAASAISFAPGGENLIVKDNVFRGAARTIEGLESVRQAIVEDDLGSSE